MSNTRAFEEAQKVIPGGVNSPVRAFASLGTVPRFIARAQGAKFWDLEGKGYYDFCQSWGALPLGHAPRVVLRRVRKRMALGTSFGAPTPGETRLARMIVENLDSVDKVRMVSSGTEAVMSAIRLARAYTGRQIILKFDGNYHGHSDALLVSAGSGLADQSLPSSLGVGEETVRHSVSLPYNDTKAIEVYFQRKGPEIAAVIVEPIAGNMGLIPGDPDFLASLRQLTKEAGALLIFDEVITGFRLGPGGAQGRYGIQPDLTTLGKVIGGGFPLGAFGGRREVMDLLAPTGGVYQAGTLSGNPVAVEAGTAALEELLGSGAYAKLEERTQDFVGSLRALVAPLGWSLAHRGSMFTLFLLPKPPRDFLQAQKVNYEDFARLYRLLLAQGVYLSPSPYEVNFLGLGHSPRVLKKVLGKISRALELFREGQDAT
jgi:glutamate-1-semialdehyde 2,1-aminomutase